MPDDAQVAWLKECLEGARENAVFARKRFPEHEGEAVAEAEFWAAALAFATVGADPRPDRSRPDHLVIETVLNAADHSITRAQEELDAGVVSSGRSAEVTAHRDAWQRLREFTERY